MEISEDALHTLFLHCLKYRHHNPFGLLTGTCNSGDGRLDIQISNSFCVLHSHKSPMLIESAIEQVKSFIERSKEVIVGFYTLKGTDTSFYSKFKRLRGVTRGGLAVLRIQQVKNGNNRSGVAEYSLVPSSSDSSATDVNHWTWNECVRENPLFVSEQFLSTTEEIGIYDYEDFLENPTRNWIDNATFLKTFRTITHT